MPSLNGPIRYGQWRRWTDAYQGWRDGRAGIPARHNRPGPVTTPHREALIRLAQDAFAREHLVYRELVAEPHRAIVSHRLRLAEARSAADWARQAFDREPVEPTPADLRLRRIGEHAHPESVIVRRRKAEHRKVRARSQAAVIQAQAVVGQIAADLARSEQEAKQLHEAAIIRVRRIHEYIHRRLAIYRRALVRAHPDGAWVNLVLSVEAPEIPGWVLPDAYLPEKDSLRTAVPPAPEQIIETKPEMPTRQITLSHRLTRFGSAPPAGDADTGLHILTSPKAAAWHFTVEKAAGEMLELQNRGFDHGPFVAGESVRRATLQAGDYFDFDDRRYTVLDASTLEDSPLPDCVLVADDLMAKSKSKPRLSQMSFVQREDSVLAILGPSGAGKSSLCLALLGELPVQSGRLFFSNMSMRTHARQIRDLLGYVPQDTEKVMHLTLTVEGTLRFGYGLRSPDRKSRDDRIEQVLRDTGLEQQRGQLLITLSGGQRRRVSIALELLTNPSLLMLDEPTSGLDASMDRQIMEILRRHAEQEHRTVIVVTHATEHLSKAHQILAVVNGGAPIYSGPPRYIRKSLKFGSYADLMNELITNPRYYADRYRSSVPAREAARRADEIEQELAAAPARPARRSNPQRSFRAIVRQFMVLTARQATLVATRALKEDDRTWWHWAKNGVIVSLPLLISAASAALAALVGGSPGLSAVPSTVGPTALALLTTLSMLSGQALTYSDIVSEFDIIKRESRAGVGALPVLASKWLIYGVMAVAQAAVITLVFCSFPDRAPQRSVEFGPRIDLFIGLAALSVSAMSLGLLISTLASKLEHAVALITATSIAQIALNGVTSNLSKTSPTSILAALLPDRWGLAACASSTDLRGINQGHPTQLAADALWAHTSTQWSYDLAALGVLGLIFFSIATWRLHHKLQPAALARSTWIRRQIRKG
jgi:ABC-type multidrug transport system ATPase subunit